MRRWVTTDQHESDALFCVVDLHALTVDHDPARVRRLSRQAASLLLASGLDPELCTVFVQSSRGRARPAVLRTGVRGDRRGDAADDPVQGEGRTGAGGGGGAERAVVPAHVSPERASTTARRGCSRSRRFSQRVASAALPKVPGPLRTYRAASPAEAHRAAPWLAPGTQPRAPSASVSVMVIAADGHPSAASRTRGASTSCSRPGMTAPRPSTWVKTAGARWTTVPGAVTLLGVDGDPHAHSSGGPGQVSGLAHDLAFTGPADELARPCPLRRPCPAGPQEDRPQTPAQCGWWYAARSRGTGSCSASRQQTATIAAVLLGALTTHVTNHLMERSRDRPAAHAVGRQEGRRLRGVRGRRRR
ncbi:hypothetical protein SVIOM342S_02643 [Streptomyces violaceorubidus]